jgi:hypothetical protein
LDWNQSLSATQPGFAEIAFPTHSEQTIPPHFGYVNNSNFRESLQNDSLIRFGESRQRGVSENPVLYDSPVMAHWGLPELTVADLNKLHDDTSVNVVYSTGDDSVLYVT